MARIRHFLDWDAPITRRVREWLLPQDEGPFDLSDTLVLVPTRQAARRLRETLASHSETVGSGLLSPVILTPGALLRATDTELRPATPAVVSAVWLDVLRGVDTTDFPALFPRVADPNDVAWAADTGGQIQSLRGQIADGAYTLARVAAMGADVLDEPERWVDLATLETRYLERLQALGFRDPHTARIRAAEAPELPPGCSRVVVACVPDPVPLAIRALEELETAHPVDILIHAPEALADQYDDWGRPQQAHWSSCPLSLPAPGPELQLTASPAAQAAAVCSSIAASEWGPADIAIGVPDRDVIPHLASAMESMGVAAYDPAEKKLPEHALFQLVDTLVTLVRDPSYRSVRRALRNADLLQHLKRSAGVEATALLNALDRVHNAYLPRSLSDLRAACDRERAIRAARVDVDVSLVPAIEYLERVRGLFAAGSPVAALQESLQAVFAERMLHSGRAEDDEFERAARCINDTMMTLDDEALDGLGLEAGDVLLLLRRLLSEAEYARERSGAKRLDLEGWLELPWNDAPFLLLTGLNEGSVPDGRLSDAFLPDSLRTRLKLPDDATRLARDAYVLESLMVSRRDHGRTVLLLGKRSGRGDPLKPSRLLFRVEPDALAGQAEALFGEVAESRPQAPAALSFQLEPMAERLAPLAKPIEKLSVTSFRNYLACPFRFYLQYAQEMERVDDEKEGLDARDFGVMVHHALEQMALHGEIWKTENPAELSAFLSDAAEAWARQRFGAQPALPVRIVLDAAQQRLHAAAQEQVKLYAEGWDIIAGEDRCTMTLAGMRIVGTIDRVDRHRESGVLRVIDYKSSNTAEKPEKVHLQNARDDDPSYAVFQPAEGRAQRWTNLQLPLYAEMFRQEGEIEVAYFDLPKSVTQTGLRPWTGFSQAHLESALRCAEGVIESIGAGIFWPPGRAETRIDDFEGLFSGRGEAAIDPGEGGS